MSTISLETPSKSKRTTAKKVSDQPSSDLPLFEGI
jgi:hypothetical protein